MASLRQIAANTQIAQHAKGPSTDEGRAASRANSMKHGLTGEGIVLSSDDADAVTQRMDAWLPLYQAMNSEQEWIFRELVTQSIRLDHCHEQEDFLRLQMSFRAQFTWDDDRALEIEILGEKLAKKPAKVVKQLVTTKQGCEWMLHRWRLLDQVLENGKEWTDAQRNLALNLLGTEPEFHDPADNLGTRPTLSKTRDLIRREIARLEALKKPLGPLDQIDRNATEDGRMVKMTRELALLRRFEAACLKRYEAARLRLSPIAVIQPATPVPVPPAPKSEPIAPRISPRVEVPPVPTFSRNPISPEPRKQSPMNRRQRRAAAKRAR
jgi:hypothetical protein